MDPGCPGTSGSEVRELPGAPAEQPRPGTQRPLSAATRGLWALGTPRGCPGHRGLDRGRC